MFIFWGTKVVTRRLGHAADFCPICRDVRGFRIARLGKAGHVYGLSLGGGELLGHQKTCLTCGVTLATDVSIYRDLSKRPPGADLAPLIAATFPEIRQHHAERIAVEDQVARRVGALDARTRAALIREPFLLLAPAVEKRFAQTHVDARAAVALVLGLVAGAAASALVRRIAPSASLHEGAFWAVFAVGLVAATYFGLKAGGRYLREAVYPKLSTALRPLEPSREEVESVLAELKRQGFRLGKKARAADVVAAVRSSRLAA